LIWINKVQEKPGNIAVLCVGAVGVPYSIKGYEDRAAECVRLANQTGDALISSELLKLRQSYLRIAERLREQRSDIST
jgi:hypothetical protein